MKKTFATFQDRSNTTQLKVKISILGESLYLKNQLIENQLIIHKLQNIKSLDINAYPEKKKNKQKPPKPVLTRKKQ